MEELGANPIIMHTGEAPEALTKGLIDSVLVSLEIYKAFGLFELINHATDISPISGSSVIYVAINKEVWNKLLPEDQEALVQITREAGDLKSAKADEDEAAARKEFDSEPGKEFMTLSPSEAAKFKEATKHLIDERISELTAEGMPAADYAEYLQERKDYWGEQQP